MDVVLVAEPTGDTSPQLRPNLVVDLRGALVHDQEGHIVFAQFTGDGGEGRLGSHLTVEKLVGFHHHDDQLARLGFAVLAELIGLVFPGVADLAGEEVRD